jgi:8-oxo-dGTP pyrophosphatase MutT (NUDIX family)
MSNSDITEILNSIYEHLPLHAEEGGEAFTVNPRDNLSNAGFDYAEISIAISIVEQLFISLGLLDDTLLEHGIWRFKSFPASLMARSVLSTIKDQNQRMFPKGFWGVQNDHSEAVEDQRNVLDYLENQRHKNHADAAQPIRYVHVAWGLISVDGKFLLRHREDKNRDNESNYVLVGGKVSQNDLMVADKNLSAKDAVKLLQSPKASGNADGIQVALDREMFEETGLQLGEHYTYSHWRTLKPYTNVGGAGAARALTEYHIHVYQIELNQDGLLALSKKVRNDDNLVWFSPEELVNAKSQDGKMAYIPALIEDFDTEQEWKEAVASFPTSFDASNKNLSDSYSITIPLENTKAIKIGKTGSEKELACKLTDDELAILLSLSLFAKDSGALQKSNDIQLLTDGWVEVTNETLNASARSLVTKLTEAEAPVIEGYKERFYRLALPKAFIYFRKEAFSYSLEELADKKTELTVTRKLISTDYVESGAASYTKEISGALESGVKELVAGLEVRGDFQKDLETFKKSLQRLAKLNQQIGIRAFARSAKSNFQLFDKEK